MHACVIHADIFYYKKEDAQKINLMLAAVDKVVVEIECRLRRCLSLLGHLKFMRIEVATYYINI